VVTPLGTREDDARLDDELSRAAARVAALEKAAAEARARKQKKKKERAAALAASMDFDADETLDFL
jgi:hypothetical protein